VLSSEQLWPNLYSISALADRRLTNLFIYNTADEQYSHGPAKAISRLCKGTYPDLKVMLLGDTPGGTSPAEVSKQIKDWKEKLPNHHFVLNATGGLKPMMAGMLPFAGNADTTVLYREITGQWFTFDRQGADRNVIDINPVEVDESGVSSFSVLSLIASQYGDQSEIELTEQTPPSLNFTDATFRGVANDWDWQKMHDLLPTGTKLSHGFFFEAYIYAGLLAMGIERVACNIEIKSRETGTSLQEVDLACSVNGRLFLIDLKLRTEEEETRGEVEGITSQIRQASETRRDLGGLAAEMFIIRPNRELDESLRLLCSHSRIRWVDSTNIEQLFSLMAEAMGIKLTDAIKQAEKSLSDYKNKGKRPFCRPPVLYVINSSNGEFDLTVFDANTMMVSLNRDWLAFKRIGNKISFVARNIKDEEKFEQAIRNELCRFGKLQKFKFSKKGTSGEFELIPESAQAKELKTYLQAHLSGALV